MSRTFSLVCHEAKLKLWVGQSATAGTTMSNFYSGETKAMEKLGRFLEHTRGKQLVLVCDDTEGVMLDDDVIEFERDPDDFTEG